MIRVIVGEWPPMIREIFYSDLDDGLRLGPVSNKPDRVLRGISTFGMLMFGLLVANAAPFLSQTQSFDNRLLLSLLDQRNEGEANRDRLGFLRLASRGYIRVGIVEDWPSNRRTSVDDIPSPLSAFISALARRDFMLSAWPELKEPLLRQAVARCIARNPDRLDDIVPDEVVSRFEGLREFDYNLRQGLRSGYHSIKWVPRSQVYREDNFRVRIERDLKNSDDLRPFREWLTSRPDAFGIPQSRSEWYEIIDNYPPVSQDLTAILQDLIDAHYNAIIAEALQAKGLSIACSSTRAAELLVQTYGVRKQYGMRTLKIMESSYDDSWLRWKNIPGLLEMLGSTSPDERLRSLEKMHKEWFGAFQANYNFSISMRIALPSALLAAGSSYAGAVITGGDPLFSAGSAALTGLITLVPAAPFVRRAAERRKAAIERNREARWDSYINQGDAAWLDRFHSRGQRE